MEIDGAATFAVTLSRDGKTLYAVNSGANSVAVIPLRGQNAYQVAGLIPTAYEPHDITFSADGSWMYIVNGKSITGPNPGHLARVLAALSLFEKPAKVTSGCHGHRDRARRRHSRRGHDRHRRHRSRHGRRGLPWAAPH